MFYELLYFSPEARHGCYILFSRCCSCCCSKAGPDVEMASDDEKGQMLHAQQHNEDQVMDDGNVPLQSKEEGKYLKKKFESIFTKKRSPALVLGNFGRFLDFT